MKKIVALGLAVLIICVFFTACSSDRQMNTSPKKTMVSFGKAYPEIENTEFVPCAQSEYLTLSFQPNTTQFRIDNSKDGSTWYSNPQNVSEDMNATQLIKLRMMSVLEIEYINTNTQKRSTINTYTSSVMSGNYRIFTIENGVLFQYNVTEIGKTLYLAVYLEKENLLTKAWHEKADSKMNDIKICAVTILPYFVSGHMKDNGYLFLPDGSGATVDFSQIHYSGEPYSRNIYGYEPTSITSDYYLDINKTSVCLPVYGAKVNGSAIMAICEDGVECGVLTAEACGQTSSYASAYVNYRLLYSIEHKVGNYNTELFDDVNHSSDYFVTRYFFLNGDAADYSGMARTYRDYLRNGSPLKKSSLGFYTDVYASVIKKVSTVGIPHDKTISLTNEVQLNDIVEKLNGEGIQNVTVRYRAWNEDEIKGRKVTSSSEASGISLKKLNNISGAKIYPAILRMQKYSNGSYIDRLIHASKSITQLPFSWKSYALSNLNETKDAEYRVSMDWFQKKSLKLIKGIKNKNMDRIAFGDISNSLYCDFGGEGFKRDKTKTIMNDFIKQSSETFDSLMLDSANAYAATYADIIYNAPTDHSRHDIFSKSVPFYTLAMSGIADCVAPPYNIGGDDMALLRTVASGAGFCVSWIVADATELVGTELNNLSNINFSNTVEEALTLYKKVESIYLKTQGSWMYSHQYISENVSVTEYENGLKVYVNFGREPFALENSIEIPAESFITIEGKEK